MTCRECSVDLEPKSTQISDYATMTILTCPRCGWMPGPNPLVESETFAFRERVSQRLEHLGLKR